MGDDKRVQGGQGTNEERENLVRDLRELGLEGDAPETLIDRDEARHPGTPSDRDVPQGGDQSAPAPKAGTTTADR